MVLTSSQAPLSRCRCLYLGAAPPSLSTGSDVLDAFQAPLLSTLPDDLATISGVDCWLTVLTEGLHVSYIEDTEAYYPISNLFVCAAVRRSDIPAESENRRARFVALDSSGVPDTRANPPVFAAILRRPNDAKIIECHMFVCKTASAALGLVQAATYAYKNRSSSVGAFLSRNSDTDQVFGQPVAPVSASPYMSSFPHALPPVAIPQPSPSENHMALVPLGSAINTAGSTGRILPPIWSGPKPPGAELLTQEQINEMVLRAMPNPGSQSFSTTQLFSNLPSLPAPEQLPASASLSQQLRQSGTNLSQIANPVFDDDTPATRKEVEMAALASELFQERTVPRAGGTVTGDLEATLGYLP